MAPLERLLPQISKSAVVLLHAGHYACLRSLAGCSVSTVETRRLRLLIIAQFSLVG